MTGRNDKLIVKGHGRADGEYTFDLKALLNIGGLNILEQEQVRSVSGVRPAALPQAFVELDAMVMVALAQIILGRNGHTARTDSLTQGHLAYSDGTQPDVEPLADIKKGLLYVVDLADDEDEDDDAVPPAVEPSEPNEPPSQSGGESGKPNSASLQESEQSPTGPPGSLRSVISGPETLAS